MCPLFPFVPSVVCCRALTFSFREDRGGGVLALDVVLKGFWVRCAWRCVVLCCRVLAFGGWLAWGLVVCWLFARWHACVVQPGGCSVVRWAVVARARAGSTTYSLGW